MARRVMERVIRACRAEAVEADLDALWREVADRTPATRTIMANLVVFQSCAERDELDADAPFEGVPVEAVAERHPSRIIVLRHTNAPDQLQAPVTASVGILLFGPEQARSAVEQITIRCVSAEASLPSIVRRFLVGDRPTSLWWTDDFSQSPPLRALVTIGRQFLYDSGQWRDVGAGLATVASLIDAPDMPDLADVNWRRLAPMRRALEQTRRTLRAGAGSGARLRIRIVHGPRRAAMAWLLAGWLSSPFDGSPQADLTVAADPEATSQAAPAPGLSVAVYAADALVLSAVMTDTEVTVTEASARAPWTVPVTSGDMADAVVEELASLRFDPSLLDAVRAAHARLTAAA